MARPVAAYICTSCERTLWQWAGRCPHCGAWNALEASRGGGDGTPVDAEAVSLRLVSGGAVAPMPTGLAEVDRVLGGGFVAGSVTLLYGPPGVGKSTLLFQVLSSVAASGVDVLLASAEESLAQVSGRAERIGAVPDSLLAIEGHDVVAIEATISRHRPALVVVDSIQSVADAGVPGTAGSLLQVKACVERLTRLAKSSGVPIVLVGHVTKDGDLAGPRVIEHLVDTVLSFDGDRHHAVRVLTAVKHRFGPSGEVGLFELRRRGLWAVPDPGTMLLGDRLAGTSGSVVVPVLQGRRPLLVEVQALVTPGPAGRPRAIGVDASRVSLLMAVLEARAGHPFTGREVCIAAVGGLTIAEPAVDLAIALALASAANDRPVQFDLVAFGELGLAGELRQVPGADRRLAEARRAGFTRAIVPSSTPGGAIPDGMEVHRVRTLLEAVGVFFSDFTGTMPTWSIGAASR